MRSLLPISRLGLAVLLALLLMAPLSAQMTVFVPDDYPSIQGAIDAAMDGCTILVRPGTYVENIDYLGKAITLQSTDGPEATVIDGSQPADPEQGSVVSFRSDELEDSVLSGFTIMRGTGSRVATQYPFIAGGGVFIRADGVRPSPTIRDCVIRSNKASTGGGLYALGNPVIESCRITINQASSGGGIFYYGYGVVRGCEITGNVASSGGGIYRIVCDLEDCVIADNEAFRGGGIWDYHSGRAPILRCRFERNSALYGGAIAALNESASVVCACTFLENTAMFGGAYFHDEFEDPSTSYPSFESCAFIRNAAEERGGAIFLDGYFVTHRGVVACTFAGNTAGVAGAAIENAAGEPFPVLGSIFWDNV